MYAVLQVTDFALQARQRLEPALRGQPWALMRPSARQSVVAAASAPALAEGVEVGQAAAQAVARCGGLLLRERNAQAETQAARLLFYAAYAITPHVEVTAPGHCSLDLRGRPDEAHPALCLQAVEQLHGHDLDARAGLAPTPKLARFAAALARPLHVVRDPARDLQRLALARTDAPETLRDVLAQWGLHTVGEFRRLPRQAVGERLGPDGLTLWDDLHGRTHRPLKEQPLPANFAAELELEEAIERLDPLLFVLRRLLEEVCAQLLAACRVARTLALNLRLENRQHYHKAFRLPEPTHRVEVIFRMLQHHLEGVTTEAAIVAVALQVEPAPEQARQLGLFESTLKDPHRLTETLARLTGLNGGHPPGSPRPRDTHRPDAFEVVALANEVAPLPETDPALARASGPLLHRFRPPRPARVWLREGRPVHVSTEPLQGVIRGTRGPWRASGDWWERGRCWRREEWDIELAEGGLGLLVRTPEGWFLEGIYD